MAYVIGKIDGASGVQKRITLSCLNSISDAAKKCKQKRIADTQVTQQRISKAAKIRQQLDTDLYDTNLRIEQSAKAKEEMGLL